MQQIIHPDAYSRYFAYISWPDPSSCGTDWIISAPRLFDPVQGLVVRQYKVGRAALKRRSFRFTPIASTSLISFIRAIGSITTPLPMIQAELPLNIPEGIR